MRRLLLLFFFTLIAFVAKAQETTTRVKLSDITDNDVPSDILKTVETKPVAPDIDLKEVVPPPQTIEKKVKEKNESREGEPTDEPEKVTKDSIDNRLPEVKPLNLLNAKVMPGTSTRLEWSPQVSFSGLSLPTPVLVLHGIKPGPTLCLTAAIHGDELNGIEVVRRVMYDLDPEKLSGSIIGVPIVNLQGFQRNTRYLGDRRDLNRFFPGDDQGSLASRVAYSLFNEVIEKCDLLVDIHTGSFRRTNLAQVRADMRNPEVVEFTEGFDEMVVVHSPGREGMLRTSAVNRGIKSVTLELGESMRLQKNQVDSGVKGIYSLLKKQRMYSKRFDWGEPSPIYYDTYWLRVNKGGILFSSVKLGDTVKQGGLLGTVTDPITNESAKIKASSDGRVLGMATDQVVMPGFAAYHIGIKASEEELVGNADSTEVVPEL